MIRGVSRCTVEVSHTGSPYFERAICFVRPEFAECDRLSLHRAAVQMLDCLDDNVEPLSGGYYGDSEPEASCPHKPTAAQPLGWLMYIAAAASGGLISLGLYMLIGR